MVPHLGLYAVSTWLIVMLRAGIALQSAADVSGIPFQNRRIDAVGVFAIYSSAWVAYFKWDSGLNDTDARCP